MLLSLLTTSILVMRHLCSFFFFFNDTATTEIYTLSLHDALPISASDRLGWVGMEAARYADLPDTEIELPPLTHHTLVLFDLRDRKSTRLNSSHQIISYAVFCLKKKKKKTQTNSTNTQEI